MSTDLTSDVTTQVYRIYIKATPQKIWDAITQPQWNARYGYGAPAMFELRPGGSYRSTPSDEMRKYAAEHGYPMAEVVVDGEVLEVDPPRKLVQTWRMLMDETTAKEPFTTLTYEIVELPGQPDICKLTVTHDLTGAPVTASMTSGAQEELGAGGGWSWILADLKTLLETGTSLSG
jgi:uncharacterized protein YndB with AHSA1/START domain